MIGEPQYAVAGSAPVSAANVRALCAAVHNDNPLYWCADTAREVCGEVAAPAGMLSSWSRPELWEPAAGEGSALQPLQLHHDMKALFDYPVAIVSACESVFHRPVALGQCVHSTQVLGAVSEQKNTRLGCGRFWTIDVEYRTTDGDLLGVESFECFGYQREAA